MSTPEMNKPTETPSNPDVVVAASRKEQGELVEEVKKNSVVTKDVPGKPGGGVVTHTLDLPSGKLKTERFESPEDYKKYIESQLSAEEQTEYEKMNADYEKLGKEVEENLKRYLKADPYFAAQMQLFAEGRLPENQIPVVQGVLYSLTENHPGVKAFGVQYEGITDKLTNVLKAAPSKVMAGLKDLFMNGKESGAKWLGAAFVALPLATIVGLETKGTTLKARLVDARYARNTLIWVTYMGRFLVTDFGGTTGGEFLGKGVKGYGNFIKKTFETGENLFTARGLSNPENWKDQWQEVGIVGGVAGMVSGKLHPALGLGIAPFIPDRPSNKEQNLQYIESNRYLAVRMQAYPGQIRALIQKQLDGETLTEADIALAAKFRRQAVHTGIANMDKSLLDSNFFHPPRRITQADVLQAYSSAAVKDLDSFLGGNSEYAQAKERQDNQELTPEELKDLQGLDPINWVKFVYSTPEEQAKQQEEIEKVFSEVLDDYKSSGETTGHHAFTPQGGSLSLDSDSFIDKPRKRTLLGFLMGGWLAATVLSNTLSVMRNVVRKIYTGYTKGVDDAKKNKETSNAEKQKRREHALKHLYPEEVVAKSGGIYFVVKEFIKNPETSSAKEKVKEVRYPLKADSKDGWGENQSSQVLDFLRKTPNITDDQLDDIIKVFVGWKLIPKGSKEEKRKAFNDLLNNGQTNKKDYTKEWKKGWEKPVQKSEKIDILGKKLTFDFGKGPQGVIDQLRDTFKKSPTNALKTWFDTGSNEELFKKEVLDKAQAWSQHPKVLEATYEATTKKVWNKGAAGAYFLAGYTPIIPFIVHHNPTPGAGKARDAYHNVGYGKEPWFDVDLDKFVSDITAPKDGEKSPDSKRVTFRPNPLKNGKIEFVLPGGKVKEIKPTGTAVIDFLKGEIKGGKFTLPTNLNDLYDLLDPKTYKKSTFGKPELFRKEDFERILMGENV